MKIIQWLTPQVLGAHGRHGVTKFSLEPIRVAPADNDRVVLPSERNIDARGLLT